MTPYTVKIDYTNWRGDRKEYVIEPLIYAMYFGSNEWHTQEQWLLPANVMKDGKPTSRVFAMKNIHSWVPMWPSTAE
jgi:hypothetical protein